MKLILVCCLFLLATISAFSQTDSSVKKGPSLTDDSLQNKIPAYMPASYFMLRMPYDTSKSKNLFFGNNIYNIKINLYNTYLPPKKWNDAFSGFGQIFLSAFGQNNNHAYVYPKK